MSKSFVNIDTPVELVQYLKNRSRLNNVTYVTKYLSITTLKRIFDTGLLLLNNPSRMNDTYELRQFPENTKWNKICFSSFIAQNDESMAMWSMYGQPWDQGVMISIPTEALKHLVDTTSYCYSVKYTEKTKIYDKGKRISIESKSISLAKVAYYSGNALICTDPNNRNLHFQSAYAEQMLAGFVKDSAWAYEREVRLRIDLPKIYRGDSVFLKLSDHFLKQITIITGPRFRENALLSLPVRFRSSVKIISSKFHESIAWIPCDDCIYKTIA